VLAWAAVTGDTIIVPDPESPRRETWVKVYEIEEHRLRFAAGYMAAEEKRCSYCRRRLANWEHSE
jgi:hypothetical protein